MSGGLKRKLRPFRPKKHKGTKCNYDERGRAAALEVEDMVLVCETAFKGHHKIQDRWENREYVM